MVWFPVGTIWKTSRAFVNLNEVVEPLVLVNKQNVAFPFPRDNCPGHRVPGIEYLQSFNSDFLVHELHCDGSG